MDLAKRGKRVHVSSNYYDFLNFSDLYSTDGNYGQLMNYSMEYGAEMIRAMQKIMEQPKKIEHMITAMEGKSVEWVVCNKSGIFSYMEMPDYVPVNEIREEMCRIVKDPNPEEDLDPFSVDPFTVRVLVKYYKNKIDRLKNE